MSVLLVGADGSQGKRYEAILKYLGVRVYKQDVAYTEQPLSGLDGIIIATPTDTHCSEVRKHLHLGVPILVEKPFSKNIEEMECLFDDAREAGAKLSMVYQYRRLVDVYTSDRPSFYDYFRHGNDGLVWDCLQIIGLAQGEIKLSEISPVWRCKINGDTLNIKDMDLAYVHEIKDWLLGVRKESLSEIMEIHHKVSEFKL